MGRKKLDDRISIALSSKGTPEFGGKSFKVVGVASAMAVMALTGVSAQAQDIAGVRADGFALERLPPPAEGAALAMGAVDLPMPRFGAPGDRPMADAAFGPVAPADVAVPATGAEAASALPVSGPVDTQPLRKRVTWKQVRAAEIAFQVLHVADAGLTWHCLDTMPCRETNPFLGHHPSREALTGFTLATGLLHYATTRWMLKHAPGLVRPWEYVTIALKGATVAWNIKVCL